MLRIRNKQSADAAPEVYPDDEAKHDHALHIEGENCARCGQPIKPGEECRRRASGDCVHLAC